MVYEPNSAIIGVCARCKQKNELHRGRDNKGYCENCLVRIGQEPERVPGPGPEHIQHKPDPIISVTPNGRRQGFLDYIIANATPQWIKGFLDNYSESMLRSYGWIRMIENEPDDNILLRMATELGYGGHPNLYRQLKTNETPSMRQQPPRRFIRPKPEPEVIIESSSRKRTNKKGRGKSKRSINRT